MRRRQGSVACRALVCVMTMVLTSGAAGCFGTQSLWQGETRDEVPLALQSVEVNDAGCVRITYSVAFHLRWYDMYNGRRYLGAETGDEPWLPDGRIRTLIVAPSVFDECMDIDEQAEGNPLAASDVGTVEPVPEEFRADVIYRLDGRVLEDSVVPECIFDEGESPPEGEDGWQTVPFLPLRYPAHLPYLLGPGRREDPIRMRGDMLEGKAFGFLFKRQGQVVFVELPRRGGIPRERFWHVVGWTPVMLVADTVITLVFTSPYWLLLM